MTPGVVISLLREYGVRWVFWRALYELALRSGWFERRLPAGRDPLRDLQRDLGLDPDDGESIAALAVREPGRFFAPNREALADFPAAWRNRLAADADAVLAGRFPHFSGEHSDTVPPDWFRICPEQAAWPNGIHWSRIADLGAAAGDIKQVWERSRFTFAFTLSRAYAVTGNEAYAAAFWSMVEDWLDANAPELGPHWRCTQEMSFRCMAWIFAWQAMKGARATTPARTARLVASLRHHGRHIESLHWYAARCVRNNHAISEAVALRTLGVVLPFLPEAARWRQRGLGWLVAETGWQIRDDGTYIQQSNNYARLVAQLLTWILVLGDGVDDPPGALELVGERARRLLAQLSAQVSECDGRVPVFGPNDGTLLLPWSGCAADDYRPALCALARALDEPDPTGEGPWREETAWFGWRPANTRPAGAAPGASESGPWLRDHAQGGLLLAGSENAFVLFHCGPNRERPPEADMLHVDYRLHGCNLLLDPGTFGYNAAGPLRDYFAGTPAHNTVSIDERHQMRRGARFLWHGWVQGELLSSRTGDRRVEMIGRQRGYAPVTHRRRVILENDVLVVIDDLTGGAAATCHRLHWLAADLPRGELADGGVFTLPTGARAVLRAWCDVTAVRDWARNRRATPRGVCAPAYGELAPAWSLAVTARGPRVRFVSVAGPAEVVAALVPAAIESPAEVLRAGGWGDEE